MTLWIWIYAATVSVLSVVVIAHCIMRRAALLRDGCHRRLARLWTLTGCDPLGEPGVSVLMDWGGDVRSLESCLTMDYLRYEVVIVGDVEHSRSLRGVLARYSMIEVGSPVVEERLMRSPRRLYRSRRRSCRRLVVVDSPAATEAERMDCALSVRGHNRVVVLGRGQRVMVDTLRVLVWRASDHPSAEIVTAPLMENAGVAGATREIWSFMGSHEERIAIMDGDAVVEAGGFTPTQAPKHTTAAMIARLQRNGCRTAHLAVAVGYTSSERKADIGGVDIALWVVWIAGIAGVVATEGTLRVMWLLCVGLVVMLQVVVAIGARAYRRTAESLRPWSENLQAALCIPLRIFLR